MTYLLKRENIDIKENDVKEAETLYPLSPENLSSHFLSEEDRNYLAPRGIACFDFVPLKLQEDNIAYIIGHDDSTSTFSDVKFETGTYRGLVSRGTLYNAPGTTEIQHVYVLDLLGSDTSTLKKHIAKHLSKVKENFKGLTEVLIYFREDFDYNKIISTFAVCGIAKSFLSEGCRNEPYLMHIYEQYKVLQLI